MKFTTYLHLVVRLRMHFQNFLDQGPLTQWIFFLAKHVNIEREIFQEWNESEIWSSFTSPMIFKMKIIFSRI
jgi:hypothetical protein